MEILLSSIIDASITYLIRHIRYPFEYKKNAEKLTHQIDKLKAMRDRVRGAVEEAERNGEMIANDVERWLQEVNKIIEEVDLVLSVENERARRFLFRSCPSIKSRYQVSRKAMKLAYEVTELQMSGKFYAISSHSAPPWMFDGDHESLPSRLSLYEEIMGALKDEDINMVGVCGMGGVGKTTLVRQVAVQAKEQKLFDVVVMAVVSEALNIRRIQEQIADVLGLHLDADTDEERSCQLYDKLKRERCILLILDDLGERLDLERIGIPSKDEHSGCKILLVSRILDVLSNQMGCQRTFEVLPLSDEEAWELFKNTIGDDLGNLFMRSTAVEIAKECSGLPVAIVSVARSLKKKSLPEFKKTLKELRRSSLTSSTTSQNIEMSYKYLESDQLKLAFLLCGLMGHNASMRNLLKYGLGLNLFPGAVSLEEAHRTAQSLVRKLRDSSLLFDPNVGEQFAVHIAAHAGAVSMACRDHYVLTTDNEIAVKQLDKDAQKQLRQIWLRGNISELPADLECPQLDLFQIFNDNHYLKIADNFFSRMHKLRVLGLSNLSLSSLPSSVSLLENLQTLCLDRSTLDDISAIGDLKSLEILSFFQSNIKQLPREIAQLTKLRLLDLSDCFELEVIPPDVFSKLSMLEELYMRNSFHQWDAEGKNNASLAELENLSHLTDAEIHIQDSRVLPYGVFFERLKGYRVCIGDDWDWDGAYEMLRTAKLKLNTKIDHLNYGIRMLLNRTEDLYLFEIEGINIIQELDREGFPHLKHLQLRNSFEIQYIISTMEMVSSNAFPILESLILYDLSSLKKICHGALGVESFARLRIIAVEHCNKLTNLFSFFVARGLSQLQRIKIAFCMKMEEVVAEESDELGDQNEVVDVIQFTQLYSLSLQYLPHLMNFYSKVKPCSLSRTQPKPSITEARSEEIISEDELRTPTQLFNEKILFPNLEDLNLYAINIDKLWNDQHPSISVSIQNLQRLVVNQCGSLKYLFPCSLVNILVQLKHLSITNCMSVEEIIAIGGLKEEETTSTVFPKLEFMELSDLPKLRRFCIGSSIECPLLKRMRIYACPEFKTFAADFSCANITDGNELEEVSSEENNNNVIQSLFDEKVIFPSLAEIEISHIDNLEKIWHNNLAAGSFCELRSFKIGGCKKIVNIFPSVLIRSFTKLEVLEIGFCDLLEAIFDLKGPSLDEIQPSNVVQLRDLSLNSLPKLKHIWNKDPQGKHKFHNLQIVRAFSCGVLKNLFPFSIARCLPQLEKLEIVHCGVEQIVAKEEGGEAFPYFMFPRLTSLNLIEIRKFRNFYPGKHTWECPKLKSLALSGCGNIKYFDSKFLDLQEVQGEIDPTFPIQQPLFSDEEIISNLEELSLNGEDPATSVIWCCQSPGKFYSRLKVIKLKNFYGKLDPIPFGFLQSIRNLETLSVSCSSFEKIFLNEGCVDKDEDIRGPVDSDEHTRMRASLVTVFVNLAPSTVLFHNLETLDVHSCHGLSNLLTSSTAKSLVQLVKLIVVSCKLVTEIVAKQGGEINDDIIFRKLEYLELVRLENLTSFCPGNYNFIFPSLKGMVVEQCPKMRIFSQGISSTPKLQEVHWKKDSMNEKCWHGNLNATLQQMYTKMVGCNGIWSLKLSDFPQLKDRWHGQLPFNCFSNLGNLTVDNCAIVSTAIPSNTLKFMNNLKYLHVKNCESLEGVFDLEGLSAEEGYDRLLPNLQELHLVDLPELRHIWNMDLPGILDFRNLKRLKVHNCSSLRNMFSPSMVSGLVQLERIGIRNCALMDEIVVNKGTEAETEVMFHKLKHLALVCLPRLASFHMGYCAIKLPSLECVLVQECPQMKTFSQGVVSTPKLRKVVQKEFGDSVHWAHDLNATIHKLFIEMSDRVVQSKLLSLPNEPTQDKSGQHTGSEGQASENLHVTEYPDGTKEYPPVPQKAFNTKEHVIKSEPESIQLASRYQESLTASNDEEESSTTPTDSEVQINQYDEKPPVNDNNVSPEDQADPIQAQELPAHTGIGPQISQQVQQASQETEKYENSEDRVMPTFPILQRDTIPSSPAAPVEQVLVLTSASLTNSTSSQELMLTTASQPTIEIPSIPVTKIRPALNFESVFASMEQLINSSPESSSQLASSSNSHTESPKSSSVSFEETYSYSMALIKRILRKSPEEVAISADRLLLLSSLKNLRNCPFLNSQQLEIIQFYLENFETLVTSHPFYEQKIDWTKAVRFCIEDDKRGITELKTSYEELTRKINILGAEKEALSKKLREIEEEEDHIRANMEGLYAQLVGQKGKLETNMNALAEAVRQERETADRACNIDRYWAKLQGLFA
uniref:Putative disease resistance gene NBS-LRR family protein n=1 Tax=Populus alba TaxID=43335 RepID=A0A4U5QA75_POPAL|nr:putative disease resistance gene NBS-LRR family protein [Populus alba]